MKICAVSDLHLREPELPEADLLILAGDLTFKGLFKEINQSKKYLRRQRDKFEKVLVTLGNHDGGDLIDFPYLIQEFEEYVDCKVLIDETVEWGGLRIFGSPYTPEFCNWYWMYPRATNRWKELIPDNVDIIFTHGPCYGILDETPRGEKVGCYDLGRRVGEVAPKAFISGHIHSGYGQETIDGTTYYNVSICDEMYLPSNPPTVFEI
jgi:Icc-related predicted phosphoesterase